MKKVDALYTFEMPSYRTCEEKKTEKSKMIASKKIVFQLEKELEVVMDLLVGGVNASHKNASQTVLTMMMSPKKEI